MKAASSSDRVTSMVYPAADQSPTNHLSTDRSVNIQSGLAVGRPPRRTEQSPARHRSPARALTHTLLCGAVPFP